MDVEKNLEVLKTRRRLIADYLKCRQNTERSSSKSPCDLDRYVEEALKTSFSASIKSERPFVNQNNDRVPLVREEYSLPDHPQETKFVQDNHATLPAFTQRLLSTLSGVSLHELQMAFRLGENWKGPSSNLIVRGDTEMYPSRVGPDFELDIDGNIEERASLPKLESSEQNWAPENTEDDDQDRENMMAMNLNSARHEYLFRHQDEGPKISKVSIVEQTTADSDIEVLELDGGESVEMAMARRFKKVPQIIDGFLKQSERMRNMLGFVSSSDDEGGHDKVESEKDEEVESEKDDEVETDPVEDLLI